MSSTDLKQLDLITENWHKQRCVIAFTTDKKPWLSASLPVRSQCKLTALCLTLMVFMMQNTLQARDHNCLHRVHFARGTGLFWQPYLAHFQHVLSPGSTFTLLDITSLCNLPVYIHIMTKSRVVIAVGNVVSVRVLMCVCVLLALQGLAAGEDKYSMQCTHLT